MELEFNKIPLILNADKERYELEINGSLVLIEYRKLGNQVMLIHTVADPALRGTGASKMLVTKVLQDLENQGKKVLPLCPFIFSFIQKNPSWKRIVDVRFKGYDKL